VVLSNRPAKVIANALRAGFHLITQRALPPPVGPIDPGRVRDHHDQDRRPHGLTTHCHLSVQQTR
jgi:hypothetical protein